jgi:hypothetical protein
MSHINREVYVQRNIAGQMAPKKVTRRRISQLHAAGASCGSMAAEPQDVSAMSLSHRHDTGESDSYMISNGVMVILLLRLGGSIKFPSVT